LDMTLETVSQLTRVVLFTSPDVQEAGIFQLSMHIKSQMPAVMHL